MTVERRSILLLLFAFMGGCAAYPDRFEVSVADGDRPKSVKLFLCDRYKADIPANSGRYLLIHEIDCEGAGQIFVSYVGGSSVACPIGYVTPNSGQVWRFRTSRLRCEAVI